MPDLYVGRAVEKDSTPEDLFHVDQIVKGVDVRCRLTRPAATLVGRLRLAILF